MIVWKHALFIAAQAVLVISPCAMSQANQKSPAQTAVVLPSPKQSGKLEFDSFPFGKTIQEPKHL